jgi:hypothetical protein
MRMEKVGYATEILKQLARLLDMVGPVAAGVL